MSGAVDIKGHHALGEHKLKRLAKTALSARLRFNYNFSTKELDATGGFNVPILILEACGFELFKIEATTRSSFAESGAVFFVGNVHLRRLATQKIEHRAHAHAVLRGYVG